MRYTRIIIIVRHPISRACDFASRTLVKSVMGDGRAKFIRVFGVCIRPTSIFDYNIVYNIVRIEC